MMKKTFKGILIATTVLGVVALVVCNFVMPTETKAFMENVMVFINQPLPIIGISIIALGGVVLTIFSRTSWGKKALREMEAKVSSWKEEAIDYEKKAEEYLNQAKAKEEETKALVAMHGQEVEALKDKLIEALKTSPNVKIQALGDTIEGKIEEIKTPIEGKIAEIERDAKAYFENQTTIEQLKSEILGLRHALEEMKGWGVQNESKE